MSTLLVCDHCGKLIGKHDSHYELQLDPKSVFPLGRMSTGFTRDLCEDCAGQQRQMGATTTDGTTLTAAYEAMWNGLAELNEQLEHSTEFEMHRGRNVVTHVASRCLKCRVESILGTSHEQ